MDDQDEILADWNGRDIHVIRSRGGVLATSSPFENLIRPAYIDWPPHEIVQKLYKSRQESSFDGVDWHRYGGLGYYCDLQSLHSEDAITWSIFGTLRYAPKEWAGKWLKDLFGILDLPEAAPDCGEISLWRRTPHPDNLVPGGPEIDFWISTKNTIILGEAKWLSSIGRAQGKAKDKDQLEVREQLLKQYGHSFFPGKTIQVVVAIGISIPTTKSAGEKNPAIRYITWDQVCRLDSHPHADEISRYLEWKIGHTRTMR